MQPVATNNIGARIVWSIVAGMLAFLIVYAIGYFLHFGKAVEYAGILGVLIGIGWFFSGYGRPF